MREKNVKEIVRYYYEIPEMVRLLKTEQREQESLYDTLKGTGGDGMPGGGGPGKPVETAVIRLDERGVYERLQEIHVRLLVLEGDAAAVRGCLDGLSGKYKSILQLRHKCHHIGRSGPRTFHRATASKTARRRSRNERCPETGRWTRWYPARRTRPGSWC